MIDPFEYIRTYYQVPAEKGRRVEVKFKGNRQGVITGARNQYVEIQFDGDKKPSGVFHPTDGIKYLGIGDLPKITRSQERYHRYREVADCFDSFGQFLLHEKDERSAKRLGFRHAGEYRDWLREYEL